MNGAINPNAAWYYPHPSPLARKIKNRVAFWSGVDIVAYHVARDQAGTEPQAR